MESGMKSKKVTDPEILKALNGNAKVVTDPELLKQLNEDNEEENAVPKTLKDVFYGLARLGHKTLNMPHEEIASLENQAQSFGQAISSPFQKLLEKHGVQNHKLTEGLANVGQGHPLSQYIPKQAELDIPEPEGLAGTGIQRGLEYLPEIYAAGHIGKALINKVPERYSNIVNPKKLKNKDIAVKEQAEESALKDIELGELEKAQNDTLSAIKEEGSSKIGQHLNEGANHAVRLAQGLEHRIGNIEKYWGSAYKDLKNNLKSSEFNMEKLPEFANDMEHVIKNIKDLEIIDGKLVIKNQPEVSRELQNIIDIAPTHETVKAEDFLTKYQDFRDARYDLLQRAKTADSAAERKALFKAYEDSKPIEKAVSKALHEGLGEHAPEFKRINEGYAQEIYPLRANKTAKKALAGKVGPNTIEDLAGFGEGQELMRELIKQDPELLRNIVGQRYASKTEGLKDINESAAEYLAEMPELRQIMKDHETKLNSQLAKIDKTKSQKNINLKDKIKYENETKNLKRQLAQLRKDRAKIWKGTKIASHLSIGAAVGVPILKKIASKLKGD
jgi:hypothetical protein